MVQTACYRLRKRGWSRRGAQMDESSHVEMMQGPGSRRWIDDERLMM